jgi:hypothetical protein
MKPIGVRIFPHAATVACGLFAFLAAAQALGQAAAGSSQIIPAPAPQPPPVVLFYSPIPPALDGAVAIGARPLSTGPAAPAALADYVNEPFYALLGMRLYRNDLGGDIAAGLARYKTERAALLQELRARLDILRDSAPAVRERELQEFAREQTPRVAALEAEAEAIRLTLRNNIESATDYFRWNLAHAASANPSDRERTLSAISILKAAVYYRQGLSPAQRGLLREWIVTLTDSLQGNAPGDGRLFRFSPDTSAIVFREDLPQDVYASLLAYREEKSSLQQALIRALFSAANGESDAEGTASLSALAIAQAPRLEALEGRAEDIRRRLSAMGDPDRRPAMTAVPADLQERIATYRTEKLALQRALLARVEEVKKGGASAGSAALSGAIQNAIDAFDAQNAERYAALAKMSDSIRTDLSKLEAGGAAPVSPDAMIAQFRDSLKKLDNYWDYRDYRNAVLQPGLSPEQRRLLFDGALQKLALPLPKGELLFEPH